MKIIKPSFEIIDQQPGIEGLLKHIELAGRTCYKSEDKITEGSAKEFVERMVKSGHGAILEQGTVYLTIPTQHYKAQRYKRNHYSVTNTISVDGINGRTFATTNYRVLVENGWMYDLHYMCEPTEFHEKRVTVKFMCDRGVSHEFVRHRKFSFAQESTRYCNYSKDKFNNELTFIIPAWCDNLKDGISIKDRLDINKIVWGNINHNDINTIKVDEYTRTFLYSNIDAELRYIHLTNKGYKPQQARAVLPNALKTELVMTGFVSDWKHFFNLRCDPSAHPQARELAIPLREEFIKRGLIQS